MPWSITVMVLGIVLIATIGKVLRAHYKTKNGFFQDVDGDSARPRDPGARQSSDEVRQLKDRIAVLERLITDEHGSRELDREIAKLRDN